MVDERFHGVKRNSRQQPENIAFIGEPAPACCTEEIESR